MHVWRAPLRADRPRLARLLATLSDDERARAERLTAPTAREAVIVARGLLREILAGYLGVAPAAIRIAYGRYGKPVIEEPQSSVENPKSLSPSSRLRGSEIRNPKSEIQNPKSESALRFNLSHSDGFALCAVTLDREVGVDLERVRGQPTAARLAHRCLSPAEFAALEELPEDRRVEGFFRAWTCKEAYAKAIGEGLRLRFNQVEVLRTGETVSLRSVGDPGEAIAGWSVVEFDPAPGYVGAVVAEGAGWQLQCLEWAG